jgi:hypothetical protein
MQHRNRWIVMVMLIVAIMVAIPLAACSQVTAEEVSEESSPAQVEHLEGANPSRIVLAEDAAQLIDIQTTPVREEQVNGTQQKVIPYTAVLYDPEGNTWTYTTSEPLTFVREPILVDRIEGDWAVLSNGPDDGIEVVTVGAAELYGSEEEFEEE